MISLPIDSHLPAIVDAVRRARAVVVTADPGAGKTTRIPPALLGDGPVVLLQPRRVAARAISERIAAERGWTVGREIGWQIRFERRAGPDTRLLVVTEGILTARLQQDPLLSAFRTIVLDEFHERSVHADLAIALARQAWLARPDLRMVVMSATLDTTPVSEFLGGCPVANVAGRVHPVDIGFAPGVPAAAAAADLLARSSGDVLCFLPGAFEIRQTIRELESRVTGVDLVPLYGALDGAEQAKAVHKPAASRRRIIVATNIAETSITVPGVAAVVDSGLQKVARYDADRGIDSLTTERIAQDSADQRAGRAGREAPGIVRRLWDARDRLRAHLEPEIHRVDLSSVVLDVIAWGGNPQTLDWFDRPRGEAIDASMLLLERLGALRAGTLTEIGRQMLRLPLHPRLARMLVAANGSPTMARACALLSERQFFRTRAASTTSDVLSDIDDWAATPPHVQRMAGEIERLAAAALFGSSSSPSSRLPRQGRGTAADSQPRMTDEAFRRAILAGYPDRVAERRQSGSPRVKLASGAGAVVSPQSGVREGDFLVALDVRAPTRAGDPDSVIGLASRVEREWLEPNGLEIVHRFDEKAGVVRAAELERYDALTLVERPIVPDTAKATEILADRWLARGPSRDDARLLCRVRFAGHSVDLKATAREAARDATSLEAVRLERALPADVLRRLSTDAPDTLRVPSGRSVPLDYRDDGSVSASVKLQELFGLAETPRIGPRREPVLFSLLAPNGRPVQTTRDLRSFWTRTYPEVRKELRGRYPKHPWPEDPWTAPPTGRTVKPRNRA